MTSYQQAYMASVIVSAKEASTAATPALLQALDDTELRRGLAEVCPEEVARLSAPQLLRRWESHVAVAEMAHNFYARDPDWPDRSSHPNNDPPLSVYAATGANWFFNLWTPCVLNMTYGCQAGHDGMVRDIVNAAEVGTFGLREFSGGPAPGTGGGKMPQPRPHTLAEAIERPVYTALNLAMVDSGTAGFGDVSLVLSPAVVGKMTVVVPMDTGDWTLTCNKTALPRGFAPPPGSGLGMPHNCEAKGWAYPNASGIARGGRMPLGTLEDHRHLVLAFLGWWKLTAAQGLLPIFARMCNSTANKIPPVVAYRRYWEANVVGTVRQPCQTEPVIAGI